MKIKYILFVFFSLVFCGLAIYTNYERPRILILHSYAPDYFWCRDVDIGLRRVLSNQSFYSIQWHYMDTKKHPEPKALRNAGVIARRVIDMVEPTILIAIDDDAQKYAAKYYINHPKISIVFCGVNADLTTYGYEKADNITGILERLPLQAVQETIMLLNTKKKEKLRISHLSDSSTTVRLDDRFLHQYNWGSVIEVLPSRLVSTFDEWKAAVAALNREADYIIISNYRKIYKTAAAGSKLISPKEIIEWTMKNATVPVIGVNSFVAEDGAHLAISTSPYEQGEVAARLALRLLEGKVKAKDIPIKQTKQFIVNMSRRGKEFSSLPTAYENFARYADKYSEDKLLEDGKN